MKDVHFIQKLTKSVDKYKKKKNSKQGILTSIDIQNYMMMENKKLKDKFQKKMNLKTKNALFVLRLINLLVKWSKISISLRDKSNIRKTKFKITLSKIT